MVSKDCVFILKQMTQFGQGRTTDEKILYAYFPSFAEMKCDSLEEITH